MENRYYTIVTDYGIEKIAESMNTGTKINITEFAIGDGGGGYYKPQKGAKALKNEVWRGMVNACHISEKSENIVKIESVIPSDEGGFTVREMGVYDDKGGLFAIGNTPDTQKAGLSEGIVYELSLSMEIALSNTDSLQLVVDPHVLTATKKEIQELQIQIDAKQEAEEGKGLSTNDFTDREKQKLHDIDSGANKTIVDSELSSSSENPIQNKAVDEEIKKLNQAIEDAKQVISDAKALRASLTGYGMTKVTDSSAVTDSTGLALAATEKNATIAGTLANKIAQLNTDFSDASVPRLFSNPNVDSFETLIKEKCKLILNDNYKFGVWVNVYGGWYATQDGCGFFQKLVSMHTVVYVIYVSYFFTYTGCYDATTDVLRGQKFDY